MTLSTKVALLKSVGDKFQVIFDGVEYLPSGNANAVGALLFGLRPRNIECDCNRHPVLFLQQAEKAAQALRLYANKALGESCTEAEIERSIEAATALAPTPETALIAHNMIIEDLGPSCAHLRRETQ